MRVSPEVLSVLATQVAFDGAHVTLEGQLDRKLYVATDKVLQACGGKWNRKAKAHVFDGPARERVELVLNTGEVQTAADLGFFPTPSGLAKELVAMAGVQSGDRVLEPSAGTGNIVLAIQDAGGIVIACERDESRRLYLVESVLKSRDYLVTTTDFMNYLHGVQENGKPALFDRVVMNPPFCKVGQGDHLDHVKHAYGLLRPGGVLVSVLPGGVTFREDRRHREFREWVYDEGAGEGTIEDLPEDSFRDSGTRVRTCVVRMVR